MTKTRRSFMLLFLVLILSALPAQARDLSGKWTLDISNYKNTCGGDPTASRDILIQQSGRDLTATIQVKGDDGKVYEGTFKGKMDGDAPPCGASLYGKFQVAGFTTVETIEIQFLDNKSFKGHSKWQSTSTEPKMTCIGTQDIKGSINPKK